MTPSLGRRAISWILPLGLSWEAGYELLYKMLEDKKIVQSDGTLGADEPDESLHSLDVNLWYTFDVGGGLKAGVDLTGAMNDSEQNYYDGLDTASLADDVFTADYYDYDLYRIRPNVSYTMATVPFTTTSASHTNTNHAESRKFFYRPGLVCSETRPFCFCFRTDSDMFKKRKMISRRDAETQRIKEKGDGDHLTHFRSKRFWVKPASSRRRGEGRRPRRPKQRTARPRSLPVDTVRLRQGFSLR